MRNYLDNGESVLAEGCHQLQAGSLRSPDSKERATVVEICLFQ